jgi:hypothetical protein
MSLFFYTCGVHYVLTLAIFSVYCCYALLLRRRRVLWWRFLDTWAPGHLPVAWCPFSLFRSLGLVINFVIRLDVINSDYTVYFTICRKLDPDTNKGNAFSFDFKIVCDIVPMFPSPAFDSIVLLVAWLLWLERNSRVFRSLCRSLVAILTQIWESIDLWFGAREAKQVAALWPVVSSVSGRVGVARGPVLGSCMGCCCTSVLLCLI